VQTTERESGMAEESERAGESALLPLKDVDVVVRGRKASYGIQSRGRVCVCNRVLCIIQTHCAAEESTHRERKSERESGRKLPSLLNRFDTFCCLHFGASTQTHTHTHPHTDALKRFLNTG